MSKTTRASTLLNLTLAIVFILGVGMILGTAWHRERIGTEATAAILDQVVHIVPEVTGINYQTLEHEVQRWQEQLWHETLPSIVVRDIGIAMVVAVLLTFGIELYARKQLQDDVVTSVVEAAFGRLISPALFEEMRWNVLGAELLKETWAFDMTVYSDPFVAKTHPNHYVSNTVQTYTLRNLTNREIEHGFEIAVDEDVSGEEADKKPLPRFERIMIGDVEYTPDNPDQASHFTRNGHLFSLPLKIGASPMSVAVILKEIIKVPDTFVWSTRMCTNGARIRIQVVGTSGVGFDVTALHPDRGRLVETVAGTWDFSGGILPWQGFQIRSFETPPTPTPVAKVEATGESPKQGKPEG